MEQAVKILCLVVVGICTTDARAAPSAGGTADTAAAWKADWVTQQNFQLTRDADGFRFPTAIAFVPNPGDQPEDPLYFVTELRGKIKVVTNDRSVYTFADLGADSFAFRPERELPSGYGQGGLAGLCLAPQQGYVFATFLYRDERGQLRNNMVRFRARPGTFSRQPTTKRYFTGLFESYRSGLAHQIGSCAVRERQLFVTVGDAWQPYQTQKLNNFHGKVLRMSFNGKPIPSNPFYGDDGENEASDYVWTYGHRNPYGLELVEDRVFVAENGPGVDRFLEIRAGENHLYDGTDQSISVRADYVWNSSVGPVQMDFVPAGAGIFPPEYRKSFFVALSKDGVYRLKYDFEHDRMAEVPGYFVRYRGEESRFITGLSMGPDGLYFTSIEQDGGDGLSAVLKVSYDSTARSSRDAWVEAKGGLNLMKEHGCVGCHTVDGNWGYGGGTGPALERGNAMVDRVLPRISSPDYETVLKKRIASADDSIEAAFLKDARDEILSGRKVERVRAWLTHYLQEPGFDQPHRPQMPDLNLTESEAAVISDYLLADAGGGEAGFVESTLPEPAIRIIQGIFPHRASRVHSLILFLGGLLLGALAYSASSYTWSRIRTNGD